ncbi:Uncharacterized protein DUF1284, possibly iron-sulphur binding [hydrothermal vent metagenome]|uniref:Uncharacterized protein DUF1284, possibly iron-sulphur binding n=1 Tax=hydrothermal vent metagenome TaxID=652676 RepID=A0A3B1CF37_9ZZZZ
MTTGTCEQSSTEGFHNNVSGLAPFSQALTGAGIDLTREHTTTLQVNVGLLCNQECKHCHLEAGPSRDEVMSIETMNAVVEYAKRCEFQTVDITGGAPEMNPNLEYLVEKLSPLTKKIMVRSNLTALYGGGNESLIRLLKQNGVSIIASLPSLNRSQTDTQRGNGSYDKSIGVLKKLNSLGYGQEGSGLEISLVSNPAGAFLATSQAEQEKKFRSDLERKCGVVFNSLFTLTNAPVGRFRDWLTSSGNFESYVTKLANSFNPHTVDGLMCRYQVSVAWDGCVFDCDFNLALGIPLGGEKTHISQMTERPKKNSPIAVSDHCYACTAGSGFTCGGAIV